MIWISRRWIIGEILILSDYHANYRLSLFVFQRLSSHLSNLSKIITNLLQAPPLPMPASETVSEQHLYNVSLLACVTGYWNGACVTSIYLHMFLLFLPDLAGLIKKPMYTEVIFSFSIPRKEYNCSALLFIHVILNSHSCES